MEQCNQPAKYTAVELKRGRKNLLPSFHKKGRKGACFEKLFLFFSPKRVLIPKLWNMFTVFCTESICSYIYVHVGPDFFPQLTNFFAGLAGNFRQELATLGDSTHHLCQGGPRPREGLSWFTAYDKKYTQYEKNLCLNEPSHQIWSAWKWCGWIGLFEYKNPG